MFVNDYCKTTPASSSLAGVPIVSGGLLIQVYIKTKTNEHRLKTCASQSVLTKLGLAGGHYYLHLKHQL